MDISHRGHRDLPDDLTNLLARDGQDPIASGGFADIYRGMLQYNGQSMRVAIKAVRTYSGEDSGTVKQKRLRREIKVWLHLRHDNVLPFLGTTMGYGRFPAMVCPWMEHGCLTSYLHGHYQSLSAVKILSLLNDVASGIQYLHSCSIVHGDLSGSNVLVHDGGRACIADFGLSMLLSELGGSTFATSFHARGTLRWTAPELLGLEVLVDEDMDEELPHVGPTTQSDVYSFGSVMLQILSGKVPYHYYKRDMQVLHAISKGMTPDRPSIVLVTERRWMFVQQCWTLMGTTRSRPLSEEIVKFTEGELAAHEESDGAGSQLQSHTSTRQDSINRPGSRSSSPTLSYYTPPSSPAESRSLSPYCGEENGEHFEELPFIFSSDKVRKKRSSPSSCGAFGDVWECDLILGKSSRLVAVKAVKTNIDHPEGGRHHEKKIRRELKVWVGLQHKNLVPLLGIVTGFGPLPSMVSPWYSNGSLSSYLVGDRLSMTQKHRLLGDIAVGLQYLHGREVVHGDLCSDNVLIDDEGTACITDFALSFITDFVGTSYLKSNICGGVRFADPALVQRASSFEGWVIYPTKPCDIYSFGGLVLHVLSGKRPYDGISSPSMYMAVLKGERPRVPTHDHITRWHKKLILQCWDQEERNRPSADSLVKMFDR